MLNFLPHALLLVIASLLLLLNSLWWVPILLVFACLKLVLPFRAVRLRLDPIILGIAEAWISGNSGWMALTQRTTWDVQGIEGLNPRSWYLVNSNHQSWVDIWYCSICSMVASPCSSFSSSKNSSGFPSWVWPGGRWSFLLCAVTPKSF